MSTAVIDGREVCLDSFEEREPDCKVPIRIEVLVPDERGCKYVYTKRYRTPAEIYRDLSKNLNLMVCECGEEWEYRSNDWDFKCPKCGADYNKRQMLIDEYDSSCHFGYDEVVEIAPRDWYVRSIMVWCEVGGNEGYSVYVTVQLYSRHGDDRKTVDVYRIKSFAGMDHCHMLVKRIMKLMGVWPNYGRDAE